jgi:polyhydroxyalkanoic acid synthase PhaR subunit
MAEQKSPTPDPFTVWRDWLSQAERQLNSYFNGVMGTEQYARFLGQFNEFSLSMQKAMSEAMARYFASLNLPTKEDLAALGQRLSSLEGRIAALESGRSGVGATVAPASTPRPPRTKKPPSAGGTQI